MNFLKLLYLIILTFVLPLTVDFQKNEFTDSGKLEMYSETFISF